MAQLEPGNQQQDPSRQYSDDGQHHVSVKEKQGTTHDFLSCYRSNGVESYGVIVKYGSESGIATQNLLQPLQSPMSPAISISVPTGFVYGGTKLQNHNAAGQQTANILMNGGFDMQANYRSLDISYASRPHVSHVVSSKHQQQERNQTSFEVLDGNKRLARGFSENDDDEDDDLLNHGYVSKKETFFQKFYVDNVQQQLEENSLDYKGLTPRSKHSATEQRRRSKINDRLQRLRQLLPNSDQKRDKASFLLEVIEHIQMLHEKVKKYEAMDRLSQSQEGGKTAFWDRNYGAKEGMVNVSHGPLLTTVLRCDVKGTTEANGYEAYQSSLLRIARENAYTAPSSISGGPALNRLVQESVCLPSFIDKPVVSKPTLLRFTSPINDSIEERPNPTLSLSGSQSFLGTMSAQMLYHEEQAAIRAKRSIFVKEEPSVAQSQLQQRAKTMASKVWSFSHDSEHEHSKRIEVSRLMLCDRALSKEVTEQLRSSPVKPVLIMRESQDTENKASHGCLDIEVDDGLICIALQRPEGDCIENSSADEKGPSAVLDGAINVSSPYSRRLLDALTRALKTSGIDLTQANISVQIDLGKPSGSPLTSYKEIATFNTRAVPGQSNSAKEPKCPAKRTKVESEV